MVLNPDNRQDEIWLSSSITTANYSHKITQFQTVF